MSGHRGAPRRAPASLSRGPPVTETPSALLLSAPGSTVHPATGPDWLPRNVAGVLGFIPARAVLPFGLGIRLVYASGLVKGNAARSKP